MTLLFRRVLIGAALFFTIFNSNYRMNLTKRLVEALRFCACLPRRKSRLNLSEPRAPLNYELARASSSLTDLQSKCLDIVSNNAVLLDQLGVDSLPSDLAQRLFDSLTRKQKVTFDIIQLFQDQILEHVSLRGASEAEDDWLRYLHNSPLINLDLGYCYRLSDEGIRYLKCWRGLKTLVLDFCTKLTDEAIEDISNLPELKELSCRGCAKLTGIGFHHLIKLSHLTVVSFEMCTGLVTGVQALGRLSELEHLDLGWCSNLPTCDMAELRFLARLRSLRLDAIKYGGKALPTLISLRNLNEISLKGCFLRSEDLDALGKMQSLTEINLERSTFDQVFLDALVKLEKLKRLKLGFTAVRNVGLEILVKMKSLTELDLDSCRINDRSTSSLPELSSLEVLNLTDCLISDPTMEHIVQMTGLKSLSLGYTEVHDEGLEKIYRLKNLTELNLDSRALTDDCMKYLSALTQLTKLDMFAARINDCSVKHLLTLKNLRFLELCGGLLTNNVCEIISNGFPSLTYLSLAQNKLIGDFGAKRLSGVISLTSLNLSGTCITDQALDFLERISDLVSLSVYDTEVSINRVEQFNKDRNVKMMY